MRVIIILLVGISLCYLAGRKLFAAPETRILQQLFYGLAVAQTALMFYIIALAVIQGNSLF